MGGPGGVVEGVVCGVCGRQTRSPAGLCLACRRAAADARRGLTAPLAGLAATRFVRRVDTAGPVPTHDRGLGGCWLWTGATSQDGYGQFRAGPGRLVYAHRFALDLAGVDVPVGWEVDHRCHDWRSCELVPCLHRRCVNPVHLVVVSGLVNRLRSASSPAVNARKDECWRGHPLVGENVYRHPSRGTRHCRRCQAERAAAAAQVSKLRLAGQGWDMRNADAM